MSEINRVLEIAGAGAPLPAWLDSDLSSDDKSAPDSVVPAVAAEAYQAEARREKSFWGRVGPYVPVAIVLFGILAYQAGGKDIVKNWLNTAKERERSQLELEAMPERYKTSVRHTIANNPDWALDILQGVEGIEQAGNYMVGIRLSYGAEGGEVWQLDEQALRTDLDMKSGPEDVDRKIFQWIVDHQEEIRQAEFRLLPDDFVPADYQGSSFNQIKKDSNTANLISRQERQRQRGQTSLLNTQRRSAKVPVVLRRLA